MGLIKILAVFFLIYLVFRFFVLYLSPSVLRWLVYRQKKKYYKQNPTGQKSGTGKSGNNMHFNEQQTRSNGYSNDKIGEYVDFEEIKEDKEKNKKK